MGIIISHRKKADVFLKQYLNNIIRLIFEGDNLEH